MATTRNRVNPLSVATLEQTAAPYVTYDEVTVCQDPNCPVCRARRRDKRHKPRHKRRHRRHRHRRNRGNFWNGLLPRADSVGSTISAYSVEFDERRPVYSSYVKERSVLPIDQTEKRVVTTSRTRRVVDDDEVMRDAWTRNPTNDDEIVCCRAYDGCPCPCWCCIIIIVIVVILVIIFIVLLATLL